MDKIKFRETLRQVFEVRRRGEDTTEIEHQAVLQLFGYQLKRGDLLWTAPSLDSDISAVLCSLLESSPTEEILYIGGEVGGAEVRDAIIRQFANISEVLKPYAIIALSKIAGPKAVSKLGEIAANSSTNEQRYALNGLDMLAQIGSVEGSYGGIRPSSERARQLWNDMKETGRAAYPLDVLKNVESVVKTSGPEAKHAEQVLDSLLAAFERSLSSLQALLE